jgi:FMN-dependent NADH-azoreductase
MTRILHIDSSARSEGSITREVSAELVSALTAEGASDVIRRDLAVEAPGFVDGAWVGANFTAPADRDAAARQRLAASDALVDELQDADVLVIGAPVYNFGVPAVLKAWIDQIARVHRTFRYTSEGPVGLLEGKRAYLVVATGGTVVGSGIDFATPYLRHVLAFVGITDVEIVAAERGDAAGARARVQQLTGAARSAA